MQQTLVNCCHGLTDAKRQLYTLPSRIQFAGWTETNLKDYKGPTTDVVAGLAENVRAKLESTYCVSEVGSKMPMLGCSKEMFLILLF